MDWTLPAHPPFSLEAIVHSHGWVQLQPFRRLQEVPGFEYDFWLSSGRAVTLTVTEADAGVQISVDDSLSSAERDEVETALSWMLDLDRDLAPFHALAAAEPRLEHVVAGAHGRLLRGSTLFEDTVKTILTTNTTWSGTRRMVASVVERYGADVAGLAGGRAFPTPERLAEVSAAELRDEARLGYRAPYVRQLALDITRGDLDLEALKDNGLPTDDLHRRLRSIKGVGPYAAANLLMILGRYDFIPIDSWAFKLVSLEWHEGRPVGKPEVEQAFARWGSWRGLAYWFWHWSHQQE